MRRTQAETGGRKIKNEDVTRYIQSFDILESWFGSLSMGDFILYGCQITGTTGNYNISSGVIYQDSELCLFDGASGVSLPLLLQKTQVGVLQRQFFDGSTKATAIDLKLLENAGGSFSLSQSTPRAEDRFLRVVNSALSANIDMNNNELGNIWRSLMSQRAEAIRVVPKPNTTNRHLKLGELSKAATQSHSIRIHGLTNGEPIEAIIQLNRTNEGGTNNLTGTIFYLTKNSLASENCVFGYIENNSSNKYEIWVKSPTAAPTNGDFRSATVEIMADAFADTQNDFSFEEDFLWTGAQVLDGTFTEKNITFGDTDTEALTITAGGTANIVSTTIAKTKEVGGVKTTTLYFEIECTSASSSMDFTLSKADLFDNVLAFGIPSVIEVIAEGGATFFAHKVVVVAPAIPNNDTLRIYKLSDVDPNLVENWNVGDRIKVSTTIVKI